MSTPSGQPQSPEEAIDLIGGYCDHLGVSPKYELRKQLEELRKHEPVLYFSGKRYRDHVYHSCRIALLGDALLTGSIYPDSNELSGTLKPFRLLDLAAELCKQNKRYGRILKSGNISDGDVPSIVRRSWFVASLMHDIAYVFEAYLRLQRSITFMERFPPLDQFFTKVRTELMGLRSSLSLEGIVDSEERMVSANISHAEVSAAYISSLSGNEKDPVLEIAARTIYLHELHTNVLFSEDPLAYLLALIDQTQEWRRPIAEGEALMRIMDVHLGFVENPNAFKQTPYELNEISIVSDKDDCFECTMKDGLIELRFMLDYGDRAEELLGTHYSFPHALSSKCRNFRKLRIGDEDRLAQAVEKLQGQRGPRARLNVHVAFRAEGRLSQEWNRQAKILLFKTHESDPNCHQWIDNVVSGKFGSFGWNEKVINIDLSAVPDADCDSQILDKSFRSYLLDRQIRDKLIEHSTTYIPSKKAGIVDAETTFKRTWENGTSPKADIEEAFVTIGNIHPGESVLQRVRALPDKNDVKQHVYEIKLAGPAPLESVAVIFPFSKLTKNGTHLRPGDEFHVEYTYSIELPITDLGTDYFMNLKSDPADIVRSQVTFEKTLFDKYFRGGQFSKARLAEWGDATKLNYSLGGNRPRYVETLIKRIDMGYKPDGYMSAENATLHRKGLGKIELLTFVDETNCIPPYYGAGWLWIPK
jgi:hypothetical protein